MGAAKDLTILCFTFLKAIIESPYIAEAAVIGVPDSLKGQVPLGLCVPKHGKLTLSLPVTTFVSSPEPRLGGELLVYQ